MAAARIVLLVFSVALFAAAWSGDQSRSRQTTVAAERLQTAMAQLVSLSRTSSSAVVGSRAYDTTASEELWTKEWQTALPVGVTPGDYLLVETTGTTQCVTLTAELLHALGHDPDVHGEPIYTLKSAERTAYLVRIMEPRNIAVETRGVEKL